ncbi:MAG: hypothetical protein ACKORF_04605 [Micrococcales bacterium]
MYSSSHAQQTRLEARALASAIGQNAGSRIWLTLNNAAGPDYIRGSNRELVSVYAPTGATDTGIFVNGKQEFAHFGMDGKHPIYQVIVELNPGQTKTIKFTWAEPTQTTVGTPLTVSPELNLPASYNPIKASVRSSGFCPTK